MDAFKSIFNVRVLIAAAGVAVGSLLYTKFIKQYTDKLGI